MHIIQLSLTRNLMRVLGIHAIGGISIDGANAPLGDSTEENRVVSSPRSLKFLR